MPAEWLIDEDMYNKKYQVTVDIKGDTIVVKAGKQ